MPGMLPSHEGRRNVLIHGPEVKRPPLIELLRFADSFDTLRPPATDIRRHFGCSEFTYQAALTRSLGDPVAWVIAPELMERVKARRDRNRARREGATTTHR